MIGSNRYLIKDYGPATVKVQLGAQIGHIPREQADKFRKDNPTATVSEE
jgi:hypothetical protein